jgi:hypothetical protein
VARDNADALSKQFGKGLEQHTGGRSGRSAIIGSSINEAEMQPVLYDLISKAGNSTLSMFHVLTRRELTLARRRLLPLLKYILLAFGLGFAMYLMTESTPMVKMVGDPSMSSVEKRIIQERFCANPEDAERLAKVNDSITVRLSAASMAFSTICVLLSIKTFQQDRVVYDREKQGMKQPAHTNAYVFSKIVSTAPEMLAVAAAFLAGYFFPGGAKGGTLSFFLILLASAWMSFGLGHVLSIVCPQESIAQVFAFVVLFVLHLFSGGQDPMPNLKNPELFLMAKHFGTVWNFGLQLSLWFNPQAHVTEALYRTEAVEWESLGQPCMTREEYMEIVLGYETLSDAKSLSLLGPLFSMFALGLLFRAKAHLLLWFEM